MASMRLSGKIASSETKYKNILENFLKEIFDISFLPSHGIDHHRRVWEYAKDILYQLNDHGFKIDESLTCKLIIACFLHDSGMCIDAGIRHGIKGRKICEKFLSENNLSLYEFRDVLHAIEYHDNKDYAIINQPADLLTVLSVADDLDVFGFIGIYRYLEIYITRNKPMKELGHLISENCENRFQHFLRTYGFSSQLVEKHSRRYDLVNSFFNLYNQQVTWYKFDNQSVSGHCGVAEIIKQMLKDEQSDTRAKIHADNYPDPLIHWFFTELNYELSESFQHKV
jgi:HD superfamily phosphodiesterase